MSINTNDLFWFLGGVLSTVAVGLVLKTVLRRMLKPSLIIGALIVVAGMVLFAWLMIPGQPGVARHVDASAQAGAVTPPGGSTQSAGSMDAMLARLEQRLAGQGGSDADWELLAQTYEFKGRTTDAQSARSHHLSVAPDSPGPAAAPQPPPVVAASGTSPEVDGDVELADALKSRVPVGLTLFIIAKALDSPGIPVAIVRTTTSHWPMSFTLNDASAMVPNRKLSTAGSVTVEARVSRSGTATPQPGDFQSVVMTVDPRERKAVRLLIDHVIG
jgi:hypothetical protein